MQSIREILQDLRTTSSSSPAQAPLDPLAPPPTEFDRHSYNGLGSIAVDTLPPSALYSGKVRDVVSVGDELFIIHTDRLTAFDRLIAMVPYKGTILTAVSDFWLKEAQKTVPTHYLGRPHERVLRTMRAQPFKVEVVVRGYLAGSMMRAYQQGEREFCGARLGEGLRDYGRLPEPIVTPTTKAAAFEHDENTSPVELVTRGVCTLAEWNEISMMALKLFSHGQDLLASKGWILVDTKYEFGRDKDGNIIVIDEIHTPDSSRLWQSASYEQKLSNGEIPVMLDKENVRRWLLNQGFSGYGAVPSVPRSILIDLAETYLDVAEALLGEPLFTAGPDQDQSITQLLMRSKL